MTDQKPTGVFVRLPLSSDDIRRMGRAMSQNLEAHAKPTLESASEAALLAIGTPVRTDGLRTFLRAIVSGKSLVGMLEPDSKRKILDVFEDIPLVRQSDAQAQIAARDAEIGEDRIPLPTYEAFCNSAKGLMSGEFNLPGPHVTCDYCEGSGWEDEEDEIECSECDGAGTHSTTVGVPWTTIKDIYRAIVDEYGPKAAIDAAREVG